MANLDLSVIHSEINVQADETEKPYNQNTTTMSILGQSERQMVNTDESNYSNIGGRK